MLSLLTLLITLVHVTTAENGFMFTSPPGGNQLNFSNHVTIGWTANDPQFPEFDLWFQGPGWAYALKRNLTTTTGLYTWDPADVSAALQKTQIHLPYGNQYHFEARLHERNGSDEGRGARVESPEYSVTGYPLLGGAAMMRGMGMMGMMGISFGVVSFLML